MAIEREKRDFFRHLDSLDEESTASEEDVAIDIRLTKVHKTVPVKVASTGSIEKKTYDRRSTHHSPTAAFEAPRLNHRATDIEVSNYVGDRLKTSDRLVRRINSEPNRLLLATPISHPPAKIFDKLKFCNDCLPNNAISKLRRLRMQSAINQGAEWSSRLSFEVTHVIVDSDWTAKAVAKVLTGKLESPSVAVIRDKWLIECLTHKLRKNTKLDRFQIKGLSKLLHTERLDDTVAKDKSAHIGTASLNCVDTIAPKNSTKDTATGCLDELSEIVQELNNATELPFDTEVDLDQFTAYSSGDDEIDAVTTRIPTALKFAHENKGFTCMEPNIGTSDQCNPNNRTIEILQQMAIYYDRTGDNWRTLAYRKAISALRKETDLISTRDQARNITGIGDRLADKIEEIVTTDRLRRLDSVHSDPDDHVLQLFMGVYGAGLKQAKLWIDQGWRSLDDLKAHATLTENQKVGIEHHHDFRQRIPRDEVTQHGKIVQNALARAHEELRGIVGGSYRRGMSDSGDVDVMITHPTAELPELRGWVFETTVPYLFEIGFMKYAFATSRSRHKIVLESPDKSCNGASKALPLNSTSKLDSTPTFFADSKSTGTKFHGASVLPASPFTSISPIWRRIDLLLVPASALGASLLYFTGNDIFNRSIRLLASRKGMRLNQYGLYKNVSRGKGRSKETDGELVEGRDERRIFEILGVPWRNPEERRC